MRYMQHYLPQGALPQTWKGRVGSGKKYFFWLSFALPVCENVPFSGQRSLPVSENFRHVQGCDAFISAAFRGATRSFPSRSEVKRVHFCRVQRCDAFISVAFRGATAAFLSRSECDAIIFVAYRGATPSFRLCSNGLNSGIFVCVQQSRGGVKSISCMFSVPFVRFHLAILPVILVVVLVNYGTCRNTLSLAMLGWSSAAASSNPFCYPTWYSCSYPWLSIS